MFKSEAQRRKMAKLERDGKVPKGTTIKWERDTAPGKLPERLHERKPPTSWRKK